MLLGGEPMDGPRNIWWNFVSSSKDRIAAAKNDWRQGRFAIVPATKRNLFRCLKITENENRIRRSLFVGDGRAAD